MKIRQREQKLIVTTYNGNNSANLIPKTFPIGLVIPVIFLLFYSLLYVISMNKHHKNQYLRDPYILNLNATYEINQINATIENEYKISNPVTVNSPIQKHSYIDSIKIKPDIIKLDSIKQEDNNIDNNIKTKLILKSTLIKPVLVSENCPASSDIIGNLGPASVITSEVTKDWLKDRWQAAANMRGEPVPGPHYLQVDLKRSCHINRVLIDWEDAYSDHWILYGLDEITAKNLDFDQINSINIHGWKPLISGKESKTTSKSKHHRIQEASIHSKNGEIKLDNCPLLRYVKLVITKPSTQWGSSVWRLQLWGGDESSDNLQSYNGCKKNVII